MRRNQKKLRGSALGFSVLILSLFLFTGISFLNISILERRASISNQKSIIAFQAADSGAERVLKRIYVDNSPTLASVALGGTMPNRTLDQVANNLSGVTSSNCRQGVVSATNTNSPASASPSYTFGITFYDESDRTINCNDSEWRDKVIRIQVEGFYQRSARTVEIGIRPRK